MVTGTNAHMHTRAYTHTRTAPKRSGGIESGGTSASALETGGSGADTVVDSQSRHTWGGDASGADEDEDEEMEEEESSFSAPAHVDARRHVGGDEQEEREQATATANGAHAATTVDAQPHANRDGVVQFDKAATAAIDATTQGTHDATTRGDASRHAVMNVEGAGLEKHGATLAKILASHASLSSSQSSSTLDDKTTNEDDSMAAQARGGETHDDVNGEQLGDSVAVMATTRGPHHIVATAVST